jgi:nucleotide-binding universal stress UspA family protein
VALDEVLLEVQRLDLVLGDDHLDVRHPLRELANRRAGVGALLEVRANARPQGLRLPDVQHVPTSVAEEVDARARWQRFELIFEPSHHESRLAPKTCG